MRIKKQGTREQGTRSLVRGAPGGSPGISQNNREYSNYFPCIFPYSEVNTGPGIAVQRQALKGHHYWSRICLLLTPVDLYRVPVFSVFGNVGSRILQTLYFAVLMESHISCIRCYFMQCGPPAITKFTKFPCMSTTPFGLFQHFPKSVKSFCGDVYPSCRNVSPPYYSRAL